MHDQRLYVTGVGLVTAVGMTREATWGALVRGERGIRDIDLFETAGQRACSGGMVRGLSLQEALRGKATRSTDAAWSRSSIMALIAAREAMAQARVDPRAQRVGLVVGGTTGGMFETEGRLAELHDDPDSREALLEMLSHPLTSTGDCLSDVIGPFHRTRSLSTACSSGANALVIAATWLLAGALDVVVAGGCDGLCRLTLSGFNALAAIDPEPCRPFDRSRRGLNLGEGAGFLVLERSGDARRRGVEPVAELAGWSVGSEAHHITNPQPSGATAARVIGSALARARLTPAQVDYVNAHGTGTPLNDPMESAALALALGEEIRRIPVSSSKGQIGHTLGAAGAIEAGISALAIARQALVPTVGLVDPDPACPLVHVREHGRPARIRAVVSNSFGFGGMDAAIVLTEPELGPPPEQASRRIVVTGAAALTPRGLVDTEGARSLLDEAPPPKGVLIDIDLASHLDLARARRLDRPARIGAVVVGRALEAANGESPQKTRMGVVLGSAFGSVDASAAFMHRLFEKGPRFASPADFPNLVPSSPVGHVSIYLDIEGPSLATADLSVSGEGACAQAIELVAAGEVDVVVAGALEEASSIVERLLAVLFAREPDGEKLARGEGAGAVVFEAEDVARSRGARIVAEVAELTSWRDDARAGDPLDRLRSVAPPRDPSRALVVVPRRDPGLAALLERSAWTAVARRTCNTGAEHEALGAIAVAAAASELAGGHVKDVLVVGLGKGRGYALRLLAP